MLVKEKYINDYFNFLKFENLVVMTLMRID